jgi:hypothetical protein
MTTLVNNLPAGNLWGARVRNFRKEITLASQAVGTVAIGTVPPGMKFLRGWLTTDTSLGTSTVAIGTAAAPTKYKAAAVFTATNTPTAYGNATAMDDTTTSEIGSSPVGTGDQEDVIMTIAVGALPASGNLVVDLEFAGV